MVWIKSNQISWLSKLFSPHSCDLGSDRELKNQVEIILCEFLGSSSTGDYKLTAPRSQAFNVNGSAQLGGDFGDERTRLFQVLLWDMQVQCCQNFQIFNKCQKSRLDKKPPDVGNSFFKNIVFYPTQVHLAPSGRALYPTTLGRCRDGEEWVRQGATVLSRLYSRELPVKVTYFLGDQTCVGSQLFRSLMDG